jgi:hypothetical protein
MYLWISCRISVQASVQLLVMTQESVGVLAQMLLSFKSLKTRDFISQRLVWRICYNRYHSFQQRVNSLVLHAQFSYGGRRRGQGGAVEAPCARDARSRIMGAVSFCGAEEWSRLDFSLFRWLHGLGLDSYVREAPSVLGDSGMPTWRGSGRGCKWGSLQTTRSNIS